MPEIIEINYEKNQEVEILPITIKAKAGNGAELEQIVISYKSEEDGQETFKEVENQKVTGKEASIEGEIKVNGIYVIQVIAQNGKIAKEEITINNIKEGGILATVTIGNLLEGSKPTANLIIDGEGQGIAIKEIQLYVAGENVKTYKYEDLQNKRNEIYKLDNLEFYKNTECYAKVIGTNNKEENSETVEVINDRFIKTSTDLRNLAIQVNDNENKFQDKTVQLIDDITVNSNWIPIGYYDGIGDWTGPYFAGTFDGNNRTITITSVVSNITNNSEETGRRIIWNDN